MSDRWPRYSSQEIKCDIKETNYVLKDWAVLLDGRIVGEDRVIYPNCTVANKNKETGAYDDFEVVPLDPDQFKKTLEDAYDDYTSDVTYDGLI